MLVRCNKYNTKFCSGSSCEHYHPHELQINEAIDYSKIDCSADVCLGLDDKYHPVKCVEWVNGLPTHYFGKDFWHIENDEGINVIVIPETVGQYTGLNDKNGKKIFEGDILAVETANIPVECDGYFKVEYDDDGLARFYCEANGYCIDFDNVWSKDTEVVGNVFEQPELIEVKE